jgi:hypothetical protein
MIILQEGDRIHLKTFNGIYTVIKIEENGVYISCGIWIARNSHHKYIPHKFIPYSDIKCLAGGVANFRKNRNLNFRCLSN